MIYYMTTVLKINGRILRMIKLYVLIKLRINVTVGFKEFLFIHKRQPSPPVSLIISEE